jgi:hypothetical protein
MIGQSLIDEFITAGVLPAGEVARVTFRKPEEEIDEPSVDAEEIPSAWCMPTIDKLVHESTFSHYSDIYGRYPVLVRFPHIMIDEEDVFRSSDWEQYGLASPDVTESSDAIWWGDHPSNPVGASYYSHTLMERSFPAFLNPKNGHWESLYQPPRYIHARASAVAVPSGERGVFVIQEVIQDSGNPGYYIRQDRNVDPLHFNTVVAINMTGGTISASQQVELIQDRYGALTVLKSTQAAVPYAPYAIGDTNGAFTCSDTLVNVTAISYESLSQSGFKEWDITPPFNAKNPLGLAIRTISPSKVLLLPIGDPSGEIRDANIAQVEHTCVGLTTGYSWTPGTCTLSATQIQTAVPKGDATGATIIAGSSVKFVTRVEWDPGTCTLNSWEQTVCVLSAGTEAGPNKIYRLPDIPEDCCPCDCPICEELPGTLTITIRSHCDNPDPNDRGCEAIDGETVDLTVFNDPLDQNWCDASREWRGTWQPDPPNPQTYVIQLCCDSSLTGGTNSFTMTWWDEADPGGDQESFALIYTDCSGVVFENYDTDIAGEIIPGCVGDEWLCVLIPLDAAIDATDLFEHCTDCP